MMNKWITLLCLLLLGHSNGSSSETEEVTHETSRIPYPVIVLKLKVMTEDDIRERCYPIYNYMKSTSYRPGSAPDPSTDYASHFFGQLLIKHNYYLGNTINIVFQTDAPYDYAEAYVKFFEENIDVENYDGLKLFESGKVQALPR